MFLPTSALTVGWSISPSFEHFAFSENEVVWLYSRNGEVQVRQLPKDWLRVEFVDDDGGLHFETIAGNFRWRSGALEPPETPQFSWELTGGRPAHVLHSTDGLDLLAEVVFEGGSRLYRVRARETHQIRELPEGCFWTASADLDTIVVISEGVVSISGQPPFNIGYQPQQASLGPTSLLVQGEAGWEVWSYAGVCLGEVRFNDEDPTVFYGGLEDIRWIAGSNLARWGNLLSGTIHATATVSRAGLTLWDAQSRPLLEARPGVPPFRFVDLVQVEKQLQAEELALRANGVPLLHWKGEWRPMCPYVLEDAEIQLLLLPYRTPIGLDIGHLQVAHSEGVYRFYRVHRSRKPVPPPGPPPSQTDWTRVWEDWAFGWGKPENVVVSDDRQHLAAGYGDRVVYWHLGEIVAAPVLLEGPYTVEAVDDVGTVYLSGDNQIFSWRRERAPVALLEVGGALRRFLHVSRDGRRLSWEQVEQRGRQASVRQRTEKETAVWWTFKAPGPGTGHVAFRVSPDNRVAALAVRSGKGWQLNVVDMSEETLLAQCALQVSGETVPEFRVDSEGTVLLNAGTEMVILSLNGKGIARRNAAFDARKFARHGRVADEPPARVEHLLQLLLLLGEERLVVDHRRPVLDDWLVNVRDLSTGAGSIGGRSYTVEIADDVASLKLEESVPRWYCQNVTDL